MDSKKICSILCAVFAAVTALFVALSVMNFTKKPDEQTELETNASDYVLSGGEKLNALAETLTGVVSNNMKKQESFPEGILEELKQPYSVNNNLVGWLSVPGTELDTAVLQSGDNSKYLKKDFFERYTTSTTSTNYGNLYLDYRCSDGEISKNMVIHGHTTSRMGADVPKQAFRSLYDYKNKQNFIDSPIIKYSSLYKTYTYKICAAFLSTTQPGHDNGYFFNYIYPDMSESNMVGYIEQVKQRALYETGVSLEPTDKIITLSTCIYDYGKNIDTRFVVVARLLHEGESEEIDASLVKDNPDYRRPQVWYNSKGKTNPYKNTAKWQPSPN
ncbi:MAG: class B sortase [Clostridia bacterium]|nr:class B sortase [Clostridia bacterium]